MTQTKKGFSLVAMIFISFQLVIADNPFKYTGNPIVRDIYTADPSAHVWADGRLYVYPSHDIAPPRGCDLMDKYHVYSTDDMVNWIDHGQILEASQVPWGQPLKDGGTFMWAPDCAYKNGKYYFYFPHPDKDPWNENWKIGIAVSDKPASDFVVLDKPMEGLPSNAMIDPCVFIDDDDQAYFYYGGGNNCMGGKLKDNMIEVDGSLKKMEGLTDFHEGAWVHKRNGIYYLSYADNYNTGGNQLRYATSDNPLGPWKYRGVYLKSTGCSTSHGSIVEYKGEWYAFYHNQMLSNVGELRSICVDPLYYNADGTIQVVKQTRDMGTPFGGTPWPVPGTIEAEDFNEGGQGFGYYDTTNGNAFGSYRPKDWVDISEHRSGTIYIDNTETGEFLNYTIEVSETDIYEFNCIAASSNATNLGEFHLEFDGIKLSNLITTTVPFGSRTNFQTVTINTPLLTKGKHVMTFNIIGKLLIDKYIFKKQGTGIKNPVQNSISVYPNPSYGLFSLKIPFTGTISVHDMNGNLICSEQAVDFSHTVNLSGQPAGIYILTLQSDSQIYHTKLIKK